MSYHGDFAVGSVVDIDFPSQGLDGASITLGTDGTLRIYKNGSVTQRTSLAGVTFSEDFDGTTGWHHIKIDTSDNTDAGFYAAASEISIGTVGTVVDGKTVNTPLASFSIERAGAALALLKSATFGLSIIATGAAQVEIISLGWHGDLNPGATIDIKFLSLKAGVLTTLAGSPAVLVYKDNSLTQSAATGITLTPDFDGVTGLNNLRITLASDGTFYSAGSNFQPYISVGTVGGTTAVSRLISPFALRARASLYPTTAGRTYDVAADGSGTAGNMLTVEQIADEVALRELIVGEVLDKTGYAHSSASIIAFWAAAVRELSASGNSAVAAAVQAALAAAFAQVTGKTDFLPSATAGAAGGVFIAGSNAATAIATALTANVTGNLSGSVGSVTGLTATDVGAIKAKTDQLTFTTPNIVDSTGSGASAAAVADAVWDELTADHVIAGSTGEAVAAGGSAGDPWITPLPGAYGAGTAGKIVGDRIAASVAGAVGSVAGNVGGNVVGSVASVTGAVGSVTVVTDKTGYRLSSAGVDDMLRTALVESYAADGAPGTLSQMLFMIQQALTEKAIVTTVMTVKKLDGSTTAATFNLNSATTPTASTRAT